MPGVLHRAAALGATLRVAALLLAAVAGGANANATASGVITIQVDATNVGQKLLQVSEHIPATPGVLRVLFPRWLPGFHGPYGDVAQIAGLEARAAGKPLPWRRDPADPFAFEITAPAGADSVDLSYQVLAAPDSQPYRSPWSRQLLGLQWHAVVLYPAGRAVADIAMQASVKLPAGWQHGSALRVRAEREGWLDLEPVSLETLVDSPLYAGQNYRRIELDPPGTPRPMVLHLFADRPERLQPSEAQIETHRAILRQATTLFGSRPWRHYDLLLAIGDGLPHTALEHHESSENVYGDDYFKDWATASRLRDDLPHEFVHSWNGKYRRPADLWTATFNTPSQNSLLWVYEGLTQYYGVVIAARAGLVSTDLVRHDFGGTAAYLSSVPGRRWRNLQDTTNDGAIASFGEASWYDWQRGYDYYNESALLIWLDADTLIREATHGSRSLDDFAHGFFGGADGDRGPKLYRFDDVIAGLNAVYPHDWKSFFRERLDRTTDAKLPLDGLERSGWRVTFAEKRSAMDLAALDPDKPVLSARWSLGLAVGKDGQIRSVVWDGPAFRAGLAPKDQLVAVAMQAYSEDRLEAAITANKDGSKPVTLLIKRDDDYRIVTLDVRTGVRYPVLERIEGTRDWLGEILAAR